MPGSLIGLIVALVILYRAISVSPFWAMDFPMRPEIAAEGHMNRRDEQRVLIWPSFPSPTRCCASRPVFTITEHADAGRTLNLFPFPPNETPVVVPC